MQTYLLSVDTALLNLANVKRAEFRIKRAIVADSFIIVPDFKKIVTVTSQSFTVELLRNTPGSIYEVIMYDDKSQVLGAFFVMPEDAANLHELVLNTSYPLAGAGGCDCTFVDLIGSPGQYAGNGGKVIAVRSDETGLEYIECSCGGSTPPIGCAGAISSIGIDLSMIWNGMSEENLALQVKSLKIYNNETNELLVEDSLAPLMTAATTEFYIGIADELTALLDITAIAVDRPGGGTTNCLMTFENNTAVYQKLRLEINIGNEGAVAQDASSSNPTYALSQIEDPYDGRQVIEFCLAPVEV